MKRAGFTMIELIFVIVILGILAAVAIPKMQGIKDDAQLANANENFCLNLKSSFLSYSMRHGGSFTDFNISKYSNIVGDSGTNEKAWIMTSGTAESMTSNNAVDAASLTATFGNKNNNVYVYLIDGNESEAFSCLIGDKDATTKSAAEAREIIKGGSNYI